MIAVDVPGRGAYRLEYLILDLNGTIATDGHLIAGVRWRIARLKNSLTIYLLTSDTFGRGRLIAEELGIQLTVVDQTSGGPDKKAFVEQLGAERVVAVGNGYNDVMMLQTAGFAIAVTGREGASGKALHSADVVVNHICDALDMLLDPRRFIATNRA